MSSATMAGLAAGAGLEVVRDLKAAAAVVARDPGRGSGFIAMVQRWQQVKQATSDQAKVS